MIKYRIRAWIAVESEEDQLYEDFEEARRDLEQLQFLQPENIYRIEKIADSEEDEGDLEGLVDK